MTSVRFATRKLSGSRLTPPWWQVCVLPADGAFDSAREHQISGMETMNISNISLLFICLKISFSAVICYPGCDISSPYKVGIASSRLHCQQECIPVGCVPPTAVAVGGAGRGVGGLDLIPLNFSLGCGSGSDPPQYPPWVWAWT